MLKNRATLFDAGAIAIVVAALFFGVAILKLELVRAVNAHWPPLPIEERQREAVAAAWQGLGRVRSPDLLLQLDVTNATRRFEEALARAVASANQTAAARGSIQVRNARFLFEGQTLRVLADFTLSLADPKLTLSGFVEGVGFLSLQGNEAVLRPAINQLRVDDIDFGARWGWILEPIARLAAPLLTEFRDNINGQLAPLAVTIPVSPLALPGDPPRIVPITFKDPFGSNADRRIDFVAPTLAGAALLADQGRLQLLADLSLDPLPKPPPSPSEDVSLERFRARFHELAREAGFDPAAPGPAFDLSHRFAESLFARYVNSSFARDRVSEAIAESMRRLPLLVGPDIGLNVATDTVSRGLTALVRDRLARWAEGQPVRLEPATVAVRPQHFALAAAGTATISAAKAQVGFELDVVVPAAGSSKGLVLYPGLDRVRITRLILLEDGDLGGLLSGLNTFLAAAVPAANGLLEPQRVGLDPVRLPSVDLASIAAGKPGVTVTPARIEPPTMAMREAALLLDPQRMLVMGDWGFEGASGPTPVPAPPGILPSYEEYRRRYLDRWNSAFGEMDSGNIAQALVKTASLAGYVSESWNRSGISVAYDGNKEDASQAPVKIEHLPRAECNEPLNCPSCKWWNLPCQAVRAACVVANEALKTGCRVGSEIIRRAINLTMDALGRELGVVKAEYKANIRAGIRDLRLDVAQDLSTFGLSGQTLGEVRAHADLHFDPKSVSGRLVCPLGMHWTFPIPGGDHFIGIPPQITQIKADVRQSRTTLPDGRTRLGFEISPQGKIVVNGKASPPHLAMVAALSAVEIQCPVIGLIEVIPGVSEVLRFFRISSAVGTAFPSLIESIFTNIRNEDLRLLYLGEVRHELEVGGTKVEVDLPSFELFGVKYTLDADVGPTLIRVNAK